MAKEVPRCMSTQHPDNVRPPFFASSHEMNGEDEIQEAYYVFSHLGFDEQMWDCEGKEVDSYVVKKLISRYSDYFKEHVIGEDVFITLRVPNPEVEKWEAKILLETLESIPRSYDSARLFYSRDVEPIFEVILPMTSSARSLNLVYHYYKDFVAGKKTRTLGKTGLSVSDWIGDFKPETISVIPLFETKDHILSCDKILKEYLSDKDVDYQRVFLARSDPALNYGNLSAVLLNKIALYRIYELSREIKIKIYPIIGVGSPPFRGNMRPETVDKLISGYPSVHTFTIQSAFKYDNQVQDVQSAVRKLRSKKDGQPSKADDPVYLEIIDKFSTAYIKQISQLVKIVDIVSRYVPRRRKRKLHIGLFGYSRESGGIRLPRAITFTAALYSVGFPPELLGINSLDDSDKHELKKIYKNFDYDLKCSLKYYNPHCPFVPQELKKAIDDFVEFDIDKEHFKITNQVISMLKSGNKEHLTELITRAGSIRRFLG